MIYAQMPLHIITGKRKLKKNLINLNTYRNQDRFHEHKVKEAYQSIVRKQLKEYRFSKFDKIEIDFVLYKGSKRRIDRSNFLSIHEKYFCDALSELKIIEDDNDSYIESTRYFSAYDKNDPRVEIYIYVID